MGEIEDLRLEVEGIKSVQTHILSELKGVKSLQPERFENIISENKTILSRLSGIESKFKTESSKTASKLESISKNIENFSKKMSFLEDIGSLHLLESKVKDEMENSKNAVIAKNKEIIDASLEFKNFLKDSRKSLENEVSVSKKTVEKNMEDVNSFISKISEAVSLIIEKKKNEMDLIFSKKLKEIEALINDFNDMSSLKKKELEEKYFSVSGSFEINSKKLIEQFGEELLRTEEEYLSELEKTFNNGRNVMHSAIEKDSSVAFSKLEALENKINKLFQEQSTRFNMLFSKFEQNFESKKAEVEENRKRVKDTIISSREEFLVNLEKMKKENERFSEKTKEGYGSELEKIRLELGLSMSNFETEMKTNTARMNEGFSKYVEEHKKAVENTSFSFFDSVSKTAKLSSENINKTETDSRKLIEDKSSKILSFFETIREETISKLTSKQKSIMLEMDELQGNFNTQIGSIQKALDKTSIEAVILMQTKIKESSGGFDKMAVDFEKNLTFKNKQINSETSLFSKELLKLKSGCQKDILDLKGLMSKMELLSGSFKKVCDKLVNYKEMENKLVKQISSSVEAEYIKKIKSIEIENNKKLSEFFKQYELVLSLLKQIGEKFSPGGQIEKLRDKLISLEKEKAETKAEINELKKWKSEDNIEDKEIKKTVLKLSSIIKI